MKINQKFLPIKSHYFLQYAGSSFLTMVLPLMIRHKGVSAQGIGILFTVMPIVGLFVNSISGALADYYKAHKAIFLISITSLTSGLISIYCLPDIPTTSEVGQLDGHNADLVETKTSMSSNLSDATEMTNTVDVSHAHFLQNLRQRIMDTSLVTALNSLGHEVMGNDDISILKIAPELSVEGGQIMLPDPHVTEREQNGEMSSKDYDFSTLAKLPQFWMLFLGVMGVHVGLNLCIMIADAVCFLILGLEKHKYGQQRLWGTIGMGMMAIVVGAMVDKYSEGLPRPDYLPAIILCGVLMSMDFGVVARMHIPYTKDLQAQMGDLKSVLMRPEVILFLVTVYVISISLGILWVFKMMMIEDVALSWDSDFPNLKLLQGLDLGIETFGGEVPFFFLSGAIIQKLGYSVVLSICMISMAVRCCLYYFVRNPWWFLPIELLNGLSYGLFHAVMASYASHVAPPGTQATLQAIARVGFSVGLSTAGYIGGSLYISLKGGGLMYLMVGLFNFGFCVLYAILSFVFSRFCNSTEDLGQRGYMMAVTNPSLVDMDGTGDHGEDTSPKQPMLESV